MLSDNLTSKANKENCLENIISNDDLQNIFSSELRDENGQHLFLPFDSIPQIQNLEMEVTEVLSVSTAFCTIKGTTQNLKQGS
ncbi:hypothetical protein PUN28_020943 [Cardiocondyla obscurior]|uniref:Uncharacterized protein n=1 Tax=Cardiocondyla obscurior TaxID=286306 RepID=A0AAW2E7S2_9HYME